jgi:hypothetical protein
MRRLHRFAFTGGCKPITLHPSRPIPAALQPQGSITMTKTEKPAPRKISVAELKLVAGGHCVTRNGVTLCLQL